MKDLTCFRVLCQAMQQAGLEVGQHASTLLELRPHTLADAIDAILWVRSPAAALGLSLDVCRDAHSRIGVSKRSRKARLIAVPTGPWYMSKTGLCTG